MEAATAVTIRDLRFKSSLPVSEIIRRMRAVSDDVPQKRHGYYHIEERGTTKISIIRSLASVFEIPLTEALQVAEYTRSLYRQRAAIQSEHQYDRIVGNCINKGKMPEIVPK